MPNTKWATYSVSVDFRSVAPVVLEAILASKEPGGDAIIEMLIYLLHPGEPPG
jgi:hypothetical protein